MINLRDVRLFIFDLDGTVYIGDKPIEGSAEIISKLRDASKKVIFLTNNSSKSAEQYIKKLNGMGIYCEREDLYSSSDCASELLLNNYSNKRVFVLGTEALRSELSNKGINTVDNAPDVVLLGYDTELTYNKLCVAVTAIAQGADYICTHSDINCPASPVFLPDAGSLIALVKASTGRLPDFDCGKPFKLMGECIQRKFGFSGNHIAMVGDRLYTDIKFGLNNGFFTILTLSGETDLNMYDDFGEKAHMLIRSIAEIPVV